MAIISAEKLMSEWNFKAKIHARIFNHWINQQDYFNLPYYLDKNLFPSLTIIL